MTDDPRLRFSCVSRNKGRSTESLEFRIQRKRKDKGADHVAYLGRIRRSNLSDKSRLEILRLEVIRRSETAGFEGDRWLDEVMAAIEDKS